MSPVKRPSDADWNRVRENARKANTGRTSHFKKEVRYMFSQTPRYCECSEAQRWWDGEEGCTRCGKTLKHPPLRLPA